MKRTQRAPRPNPKYASSIQRDNSAPPVTIPGTLARETVIDFDSLDDPNFPHKCQARMENIQESLESTVERTSEEFYTNLMQSTTAARKGHSTHTTQPSTITRTESFDSDMGFPLGTTTTTTTSAPTINRDGLEIVSSNSPKKFKKPLEAVLALKAGIEKQSWSLSRASGLLDLCHRDNCLVKEYGKTDEKRKDAHKRFYDRSNLTGTEATSIVSEFENGRRFNPFLKRLAALSPDDHAAWTTSSTAGKINYLLSCSDEFYSKLLPMETPKTLIEAVEGLVEIYKNFPNDCFVTGERSVLPDIYEDKLTPQITEKWKLILSLLHSIKCSQDEQARKLQIKSEATKMHERGAAFITTLINNDPALKRKFEAEHETLANGTSAESRQNAKFGANGNPATLKSSTTPKKPPTPVPFNPETVIDRQMQRLESQVDRFANLLESSGTKTRQLIWHIHCAKEGIDPAQNPMPDFFQ